MFKHLLAGAVASVTLVGGAQAATLTGVFDVTVVNVTNVTSSESEARFENAQDAFDKATNEPGANFGGDNSIATVGRFTFDGALDFGTSDGTDSTTIQDWLNTSAGSTTTWIGDDLGGTQLSKDGIGNGTATTSFFYFELVNDLGAGDFTVTHDDGFAIFSGEESGENRIGGRNGPTVKVVTEVLGFEGGVFDLLYVATNGDPSVLNVNYDASPIPVPASLPLLLAGMGGLAFMRRRQKS